MKRLIALLLAVLMCLCLCACGEDDTSGEAPATKAPGGSIDSTTGNTESEQAGSDEETTAPTTAPGLELSDDLADFTVSIEGVVYQLPCSPQVFLDNGWLPESDWVLEDDYMYPGDSQGSLDLYKEGENKEIGLRICNLSNNEKPLSEIIVIGIYNEVDTDVEFTFGGGFAVTDNVTENTVFSVMGSDYTHNEFNGDWYDYSLPGKGSYEFAIKDGVLSYFAMELAAAMYKN